jgi:hypothetical protein
MFDKRINKNSQRNNATAGLCDRLLNSEDTSDLAA